VLFFLFLSCFSFRRSSTLSGAGLFAGESLLSIYVIGVWFNSTVLPMLRAPVNAGRSWIALYSTLVKYSKIWMQYNMLFSAVSSKCTLILVLLALLLQRVFAHLAWTGLEERPFLF